MSMDRSKQNAHRVKWQMLRAKITSVLRDLGKDLKSDEGPQFYAFIGNVARMYHEFSPNDDLHLTRREDCKNTIITVFNDMPANVLPYGGDVDDTVTQCEPILEAVFDMPALRPEKDMCPYLLLHLPLF